MLNKKNYIQARVAAMKNHEVWVDAGIKPYDQCYRISNLGRFESKDRYDRTDHFHKGRILRYYIGTDGYPTVSLNYHGKQHHISVHRLEMLSFCPNPDPRKYTQVDHKDSNKLNNRLDNLRWCTTKQNDNFSLHRLHVKESVYKTPVIISKGSNKVQASSQHDAADWFEKHAALARNYTYSQIMGYIKDCCNPNYSRTTMFGYHIQHHVPSATHPTMTRGLKLIKQSEVTGKPSVKSFVFIHQAVDWLQKNVRPDLSRKVINSRIDKNWHTNQHCYGFKIAKLSKPEYVKVVDSQIVPKLNQRYHSTFKLLDIITTRSRFRLRLKHLKCGTIFNIERGKAFRQKYLCPICRRKYLLAKRGKQVILEKSGHKKQFASASTAAKYLHKQFLSNQRGNHSVGTIRKLVSECCNGKRYTAYGYRACFVGHKLPSIHRQRHPHKPVVLYRDGNSKQFTSAVTAAKYMHDQLLKNRKEDVMLDTLRKSINDCCNGHQYIVHGYRPCFVGRRPQPVPDIHQATRKPVILFNQSTSKRFKSAPAAARWLQTYDKHNQSKSVNTMRRGISACCNGHQHVAYGFHAKFA